MPKLENLNDGAETETTYTVEIQAKDGEWHWAGRAADNARDAAAELEEVVALIQGTYLKTYYRRARVKKTVSVVTYGPEAEI